MPIQLVEKETGRILGEITPKQLADLQELLEEEAPNDRDRYVDMETIDYLEAQGGDPALCELLREAVKATDGIEVEWRDAPEGRSAPGKT